MFFNKVSVSLSTNNEGLGREDFMGLTGREPTAHLLVVGFRAQTKFIELISCYFLKNKISFNLSN